MSDPRRLIDDKTDGFETTLLESARRDGPSAHARARTLAALGLGVSALGAAGTGTAATTTATSGKGVGTWLVLGMLAGGGALGVAEFQAATNRASAAPSARPSLSAQAPPSAQLVTPVRADAPLRGDAPLQAPTASSRLDARVAEAPERPSRPEPVTVAPSTPAVVIAEPRPTAETPPARLPEARSEAAAGPASVAPASTLTEELAMLDEARAGLGRGDTASALATLDRYQQRFPRGVLGLEAQVLRIDLLWQRGDQAGARQLAGRFVAAHPASPHSPRLRAMLGP